MGGLAGRGKPPWRRGGAEPGEVFRAADGYLTVGVANNSLWGRFCEALGRPDLATDPRFDTEAKRVEHRDVLVPLFDTAPEIMPGAGCGHSPCLCAVEPGRTYCCRACARATEDQTDCACGHFGCTARAF